MSELFYANLNIPNYNYEQDNAKYRLRDFINYLRQAIRNEENQEYSINWKRLGDEEIEEIVKNKFELELSRREPYDSLEEIILDDLTLSDSNILTELNSRIQNELMENAQGKKVWIKIFEKKETEKGFKILQNFFRDKFIYDNNELSEKDRIKILDKQFNFNALLLERIPKSREKIYLKYRAIPLIRQLYALEQLKLRPQQMHLPLLKLIMNKSFARWPKFNLVNIRNWYLLTEDNREGIQEQREFVRIALSTPDFAILEGPPGSGKTHTICELILQVISQNKRVLLCASTHVAVDNVLEKIKTHPSVIAIRLGKDNVSETVRDCQLDEIEFVESKKIKKRLMSKKRRNKITKSQEYLLNCLEAGKKEIISELFLGAANVICGTTIGMLKHPEITRGSSISKTSYDYLILDEASKTTFQEFLVPALFAEKWIIVGDYRQLSPYIDAEDVEGNIKGVLEPEYEQICLDIFECYFFSSEFKKDVKSWKNLLVIENNKEMRKMYEEQVKALNLDYIRIENDSFDPLELLSTQIIISSHEILEKLEADLPMDIHLLRGDCKLENFLRKRSYWINKFNPDLNIQNNDGNQRGWAYEIAWRLIRAHETRNTSEKSENYLKQINGLCPHFSISNGKLDEEIIKNELTLYNKVYKSIDLVRRIGLPSIIESLQKGYKKSVDPRFSYVLSDGFNDEDIKQRHLLLKYQYRMHSDISEFPRKYIYNEEALKDSALNDLNWDYSRYKSRVIWINTPGVKDESENKNQSEVKNIKIELDEFIKWAENHKNFKSNKPWKIAILTFYSAQERLIRKELQKKFNTNRRRYFDYPKKNISIELCIVDKFQGQEADVVFLSFVQTSTEGFLNSINRLNVALTRAKYQLFIFGKYDFYKRESRSEILKNLAKFYKGKVSYLK